MSCVVPAKMAMQKLRTKCHVFGTPCFTGDRNILIERVSSVKRCNNEDGESVNNCWAILPLRTYKEPLWTFSWICTILSREAAIHFHGSSHVGGTGCSVFMLTTKNVWTFSMMETQRVRSRNEEHHTNVHSFVCYKSLNAYISMVLFCIW